MTPFNKWHTRSSWCSLVSMTLSCIISETKRDIGRKSQFLSRVSTVMMTSDIDIGNSSVRPPVQSVRLSVCHAPVLYCIETAS